jgi:hypothetical protein
MVDKEEIDKEEISRKEIIMREEEATAIEAVRRERAESTEQERIKRRRKTSMEVEAETEELRAHADKMSNILERRKLRVRLIKIKRKRYIYFII